VPVTASNRSKVMETRICPRALHQIGLRIIRLVRRRAKLQAKHFDLRVNFLLQDLAGERINQPHHLEALLGQRAGHFVFESASWSLWRFPLLTVFFTAGAFVLGDVLSSNRDRTGAAEYTPVVGQPAVPLPQPVA
jgi:hypothetical protein